MNFALVPSSVQ